MLVHFHLNALSNPFKSDPLNVRLVAGHLATTGVFLTSPLVSLISRDD
jgi:hypothetical protein